MEKKDIHFVLIHGACHGAWCWYKVVTLLKSAGYRVAALDMAAAGIHPKQLHEIRSISDYYEPLMEFMASLPRQEKVILVGHSLGGLSISVAMEKFPQKISVAVFITAVNPSHDFPFHVVHAEVMKRQDSFMDTQFKYDEGLDKPPTSRLFGPQFMASKLYQLSPSEDLSLALSLVRPVRVFNDAELLEEETAVSKERHRRVPKVYIICEKDNLTNEDMQRWMIERNPPNEVKLIADSDHMVMFSKPVELCSCLQQIADNYEVIANA